MELYEIARSYRSHRYFSDNQFNPYSYGTTRSTCYEITADPINDLRRTSSYTYRNNYEPTAKSYRSTNDVLRFSFDNYRSANDLFRTSWSDKSNNDNGLRDSFTSRRQREHVSLYDTLIDTDPVSTEDEWRRYVDRGCLVEKAVEALRRRHRYPKDSFEYSPESRSPYSYQITPTTKWVSPPKTPTDKYGRKVRDKGMEAFEKNVVKDPNSILWYTTEEPPKPKPVETPRGRRKLGGKEISLASVQEAENESTPSPQKTSTNSIKALRSEIIDKEKEETRKSEKDTKFSSYTTSKDSSSWKSERKNKDSPEKERKLLSEMEDRKKKRKSLEEDSFLSKGKKDKDKEGKSQKSNKIEEETAQTDKKQTKTHKLFDSIKHSTIKRSKSRGKNDSRAEKLAKEKLELEKAKESNESNIDKDDKPDTNGVKYRDEHVSSKARPTTMYELELDEEESDKKESNLLNTSKSESKDSKRNSSFHDDDSIRKNKSSSSFHEYIPGHNVPLKERLRRKQMEQEQREQKEKTERFSTTTNDFSSVIVPDRSLAQRASKIIKAKYHSSEPSAVGRDDGTTSPTPTSGRSSLTSKFFRRFMGGEKEEGKATSEENNNKASSIRRRKLRKDSENDENDDANKETSSTETKTDNLSQTTTSKFNSPNKLTEIKSTTKENQNISKLSQDMTADLTNHVEKTPERFRRRRIKNDDDNTSPRLQKTADKTKDDVKKDDDALESVVYRRKKQKDEEKIKLQELQRKSLFVFEDEIVPSEKRAEKMRLQFRSPDRSRDEIEEDIMEQEKVRFSANLTDDIFDCLKDAEVSVVCEDSDLAVEKKQDCQIDDDLFARLDQMTPDGEKPSFFIGEDESHDQNEPIKSEPRDLKSFLEPIEKENELKIQHLDDMFDEIESINQSMYEELLNLTKQEAPQEDTETNIDSDDEVFRETTAATGGSLKTAYDPATSKTNKLQKKKIDKGDLMATDKFEATKERWGIRSLSRGISFDGSMNMGSKPTSSKPRSRNDSSESRRSSSLLETHDDAVKYVAKYTNISLEELKTGTSGGDTGARAILPSPNEGGNTGVRTFSPEDVSEVEKTRKDVDKMLLNCQNIDKINNSLTETVPASATGVILKDPDSESAACSLGTDPKLVSNAPDTDSVSTALATDGVHVAESVRDVDNEVEETTRRISLLIEQAESEENHTVESVMSDGNVNADTSNTVETPGIDNVDVEKNDDESERKERSPSNLSVDQATDSLSAYSPTISEYGTPPKSPVTSDVMVESPEHPEKLVSTKDVEAKEDIATEQSQPQTQETALAEIQADTTKDIENKEEANQQPAESAMPAKTSKTNAEEKKTKRRSSYLNQRQSHMGLFSITSPMSQLDDGVNISEQTGPQPSLEDEKAQSTPLTNQSPQPSVNEDKAESTPSEFTSNIEETIGNIEAPKDVETVELAHLATQEKNIIESIENSTTPLAGTQTPLALIENEVLSPKALESNQINESPSKEENPLEMPASVVSMESSVSAENDPKNSEESLTMSKETSPETPAPQIETATEKPMTTTTPAQTPSPSKLVQRPSLGSLSSLTDSTSSFSSLTPAAETIKVSQESNDSPFKLIKKPAPSNQSDTKIERPESPFKLTKRPSLGSLSSLTSLSSSASTSQLDDVTKPEPKESPFKLTKKPSLGSLTSLTSLVPATKPITGPSQGPPGIESPFKLKKSSLSGSLTSLSGFGAAPTADGTGPFKLSKVSSTSRLSLLQPATIPSIMELPGKLSSEDRTQGSETRENEAEVEQNTREPKQQTQKEDENEHEVASMSKKGEEDVSKEEITEIKEDNTKKDVITTLEHHPNDELNKDLNNNDIEKSNLQQATTIEQEQDIPETTSTTSNIQNSTSRQNSESKSTISRKTSNSKTQENTGAISSTYQQVSESKSSASRKASNSKNMQFVQDQTQSISSSRKGSQSTSRKGSQSTTSELKTSTSRKASESGISSDIKGNPSKSQSRDSTISASSGLSSDDDIIIKRDRHPVLEKQLSIKEYRLRKMQREGTFESVSDDGQSKSEFSGLSDFSAVSSLADISDASVENENNTRQKKYSHSKKDLRDIGIGESSSSESDIPIIKTTGQRISERFERLRQLKSVSTTIQPTEMNDSSTFTRSTSTLNTLNGFSRSTKPLSTIRSWHSSGEKEPSKTTTDRRRYLRREFKSVDKF
ncbi:uro-adherence factor A-like isoform X2 [Clytia hemisphaerica]|uniref:Uncharacterized protein n=1 Tax=Clytia hemisphaerica TaxID=252671 RepID=A0A7M5WTG8_9CNID